MYSNQNQAKIIKKTIIVSSMKQDSPISAAMGWPPVQETSATVSLQSIEHSKVCLLALTAFYRIVVMQIDLIGGEGMELKV